MTAHVFVEYREMCGAGANHQYCTSLLFYQCQKYVDTYMFKSGTSNKMYIQKLKVYVVKVASSVCL